MSTHRYRLPVAPTDDPDALQALLTAAGALGTQDFGTHVLAWFTAPTDAVPGGGTWAVEPDRDWQVEWKASIDPVRAGRFLVIPSWLAADGEPAEPDCVVMVIDPGQAFGTGHHATTTLCLEALEELPLDGRSVADVGTGTGVLAMAAAALGADPVVGVDIDPTAVEVATANIARHPWQVDVLVGSVEAVPPPPGADGWDVVVANLLTGTIGQLADSLVGLVRPGGWLITSGIHVDREDVARAPLVTAGLALDVRRERDGWVMLRGTRS